jgi:hypothetical protein
MCRRECADRGSACAACRARTWAQRHLALRERTPPPLAPRCAKRAHAGGERSCVPNAVSTAAPHPVGMAERSEARSLVQHLSDQASVCVADCARLARVACNDSRVEARRVRRLPPCRTLSGRAAAAVAAVRRSYPSCRARWKHVRRAWRPRRRCGPTPPCACLARAAALTRAPARAAASAAAARAVGAGAVPGGRGAEARPPSSRALVARSPGTGLRVRLARPPCAARSCCRPSKPACATCARRRLRQRRSQASARRPLEGATAFLDRSTLPGLPACLAATRRPRLHTA